ncbi:MAG TPA: FliH/SctL family protein [Rhizomicrobium sp.]|nr:FliH/SctL family protein [Rhizomicrobium sp.]
MASQSKFTFDTEFLGKEDRQAPAARARQKQTLTTEELERIRAEARIQGENSAQARNTEALDRSIAALTISVRATLDQSHGEIESLRDEAARLALAMAKRIASAALAALPTGDVEIALRQAMHQAIGEPRITLRTSPVVAQAIEPRLAAIAQEEGYDGRIAIAAEPGMKAGDCRIEWRGGGAERSEDAIEEALTSLITHRFSASVKG